MAACKGLGPRLLALKTERGAMDQVCRQLLEAGKEKEIAVI